MSGTIKAYYKLESGGTDYSGNGFNLTGAGTPTYVPGKFGNCVNLVRTSSQRLTAASNTGITGNYTFGAWVYLADIPTGNTSTFYGVMGMTVSTSNAISYIIIDNYSGTKRIFCSRTLNGGAGVNAIWTPAVYSALVWYHIVSVYDGTNIYLYVDGKFRVSSAASGNGPTAVTAGISIGDATSGSGFSNYYFNGRIDEAFFANTAWTAAQVRDYYANARGLRRPSIV